MKVQRQFDRSEGRLIAGADLIEHALSLLDGPQEACLRQGPDKRRQMNLAVSERPYVIEVSVSEATLKPLFDELVPGTRLVPRKLPDTVSRIRQAPLSLDVIP